MPGRPFQKGQSGNPSGRPKEEREVTALARQHSVEAVETLVHIMRNCESWKGRKAAADSILDRALGKPKVVVAGDDESPIVMEMRGARELLLGRLAQRAQRK